MSSDELDEIARLILHSGPSALYADIANGLRERLLAAGWRLPKRRRGAAGSETAAENSAMKNAETIDLPRVLAAATVMAKHPYLSGKLTCGKAVELIAAELATKGHHVDEGALAKWLRSKNRP